MEQKDLQTILKESGVLGKIWEDIFGPSAKKVGKALGSITGVLLTSLKKYEYYSETEEILLQKYLEQYRKELDKFSEEEIIEAPPEIAKPLIDRFEFVKNKDLGKAFLALLVNASNEKGSHLAHPAFIHKLDMLSSDEAKIISHLKVYDGFPHLIVRALPLLPPYDGPQIDSTMTGLEMKLDLVFPKNIGLYLDNLISLGLIKYDIQNSPLISRAIELERIYEEEISHFEKMMGRASLTLNKSHFWIHPTALGRKFIEAVTESTNTDPSS